MTRVRGEISKKNQYYLEKNRSYELMHFCRQYPIWKQARDSLSSLAQSRTELEKAFSGQVSDPTAKAAESRERWNKMINMVEQAARETDPVIGDYILKGVTEGVSYEVLKSRDQIPCGKDLYYTYYRKFFWILNRLRD